jgi:hypothetical protein
MMKMQAMRRWVFGTGTAAALAFGGAQAMAAPASAPAETGPVCDSGLCNRACQAAGMIGGFCTEPIGCSCYL